VAIAPAAFQFIYEALVMKIPVETKPALWGMAGGAIAAAIVGFSWGGWVTGGRAEADATQRAHAAVVVALAPVCVERFQRATDVTANLAALNKVDSWSRGDFIEKGGWATVHGSKAPDEVSAVAQACALLLVPAVG
jgi:alpha/beta superfamily hydrolase